jgi:hypothetical protein
MPGNPGQPCTINAGRTQPTFHQSFFSRAAALPARQHFFPLVIKIFKFHRQKSCSHLPSVRLDRNPRGHVEKSFD